MLTGNELLAKVKELGDVSKSELVRSTGYVSTKKDGSERLNFTEFYEALLKAKGVRFNTGSGKSTASKRVDNLSYVATVQSNGNLLIDKAYTRLLGLKPGDQLAIKLSRKQIKLIYEEAAKKVSFAGKVPSQPPSLPIDGFVVPVWFATNRKPKGRGFGSQRNDHTSFGRVLVHVPEAHSFGGIGSSIWQRLRRLDWRNDRLKLQEVESRDRDSFFMELRTTMDIARKEGVVAPQALLYLHGFNVNFQAAAIRAAQLNVDLKVSGATAFFSWPSWGKVAGYLADTATIDASEKAITEFLISFTRECGADKVHLIAHSMGNRGLLRSLQRIADYAESQSKVRFGQIFLAAPDVDRDLFLDLANLYPKYSERATLYASDKDRAVWLSGLLHQAPRAGYFTPYTVAPGVDTVEVPSFNIDFMGHGYFAEAAPLLHDIYDLMRHDTPPRERQGLIPKQHDGLKFWKFRL